MLVPKVAQDQDAYRRPHKLFPSARSAFGAFLRAVCPNGEGLVLLPAYIGWSMREGSGVLDPVEEFQIPYAFYPMTERLHIDLERFEESIQRAGATGVVLIHYFGFVDPCYEEAVRIARRYGAWVLEDEAHAMLTDLVGGRCGRLGDAAIMSLHKLLPVSQGGLLFATPSRVALLEGPPPPDLAQPAPWEFDLWGIAQRRIANARLWKELLQPLAGSVEPLWPDLSEGEAPQTYPVLIHGVSRDALYERMNAAGYGVVSLYHTMVSSLRECDFPVSHRLSRHIMNLPVHQDVDAEALTRMADVLTEQIERMSDQRESQG